MTDEVKPLPDTEVVRAAQTIFRAVYPDSAYGFDALSRDRQMFYVDLAERVGCQFGVQFSTCGDRKDDPKAELSVILIERCRISDNDAMVTLIETIEQAGEDFARRWLDTDAKVPW